MACMKQTFRRDDRISNQFESSKFCLQLESAPPLMDAHDLFVAHQPVLFVPAIPHLPMRLCLRVDDALDLLSQAVALCEVFSSRLFLKDLPAEVIALRFFQRNAFRSQP